jgi:hypothetical protein
MPWMGTRQVADQGIMPHSDSLLAMGAATRLMNSPRSLRRREVFGGAAAPQSPFGHRAATEVRRRVVATMRSDI